MCDIAKGTNNREKKIVSADGLKGFFLSIRYLLSLVYVKVNCSQTQILVLNYDVTQ